MVKIAIIGAGAAGCFCTANLLEQAPGLSVALFEAGPRPLAKVSITGGGRCNLTNSFEGIRSLAEAYPRGERVMKRALKAFSQEDTCVWFHGASRSPSRKTTAGSPSRRMPWTLSAAFFAPAKGPISA